MRLAVAATASVAGGLFAYAGFLIVEWILDPPAEPLNAALIILFSAGWGFGLLTCARGLSRRQRWARSPVLTSDLVLLAVGWALASGQGGEVWIGWVVVILTVACLASLLRPGVGQALR